MRKVDGLTEMEARVEQCPCGGWMGKGCMSYVIAPMLVKADASMSKEQARRIVACINAAVGTDTKTLEAIAKRKIKALKKEARR